MIIVRFLALCVSRMYQKLAWNLPLIGMLPALLLNVGRIHEICTLVLTKTPRRTFHFRGPSFANMDMLLTADPANVHHILTANFLSFPKGNKFKEIFDIFGDGIFNADSDSWKEQRGVARTLLTHRGLPGFLSEICRDKAERGLIPVLDTAAVGGSVVDLQDLFQRLTFDTTCVLITGFDPGCLSPDLPHVPFSSAMDEAEEAIFMRHVMPEIVWKLQRWFGVGSELRLKRAKKTLNEVVENLIWSKRRRCGCICICTCSNESGKDLLSFYLSSSRDNNRFNDGFLRDTVLNLMIAGWDTVSSALTWLTWLVSTHPEVESKIMTELELSSAAAAGRRRRVVFTVEEAKKMVYIHGAVLEALRLYPPVPFQHKEALNEGILPTGHFVKPEMKVMISLYAMGRMESIWGKDCLEFKPERWISGGGGAIRHEPSYKFLAFNAGPRTCLGKAVALGQIKAVAATLIYNYRVRVAEGHLVAPNCSVVLYMRHGLKVEVSDRWSS